MYKQGLLPPVVLLIHQLINVMKGVRNDMKGCPNHHPNGTQEFVQNKFIISAGFLGIIQSPNFRLLLSYFVVSQ